MHALRVATKNLLHSHHQSAALLTRATPPRTRPTLGRFLGGPTLPPPTTAPPTPTGVAAAVGLASGTLGALCGVGGAVFAIPGLVRYASLPQRVAAGNSLIAVTGIAATSAASFANAGHVHWDVAMILGGTAALFTPLGARMSAVAKPALLRKALGAFMVVLAPVMPLRAYLERRRENEVEAVVDGNGRTALLGGVGSGVGFVSGLLGISGGSLFTPLVAVTCADGSLKSVLGTSFAAMVVPTMIGAVSYARMGCVALPLVSPMVAGAVIGASAGSTAALAVPEEGLRWVFSVVFAVLGVRVLRAPIKAGGKPDIKPNVQHAHVRHVR